VAYGYERRDPRQGVIDSGVSWAARDLYDVTAAIDGDWTKPPVGDRIPAELRLLLRGLLEDRFALKARIEMKRVDVFALRQVKGGAVATPGLRRSTDECVGPYTDPASIEAAGRPACTLRIATETIQVGSLTMIQLADLLATRQLADRPIVDDTGLTGTYDVHLTTGLRPSLTAMPSSTREAQDNTLREYAGGITFGDGRWAPAVKRALKEQLGLELKEAKLPIPTLRIESARRPSED